MEKKLHVSLPSNLSALSLPDPHHSLQQTHMEEEFSAELAVLQQQKMMPRPEAVAHLLQMIAQQSVAEQH
ncbi:hypothetical protein [Taibaiella koreensis]|uniref:hypothetical protein n=1 Tax=Taibaiella koreensis TaxID=1268548 RepID=UPI000E599CDD|nr:hypothetical protein [Taibaiella koreensis]